MAKSTIKSVSAVLASGVLPFAITLVTLPILLPIITLERYGILAIVWMISGSFAFAQFGMDRAVVQRLNALRIEKSDISDISENSIRATSIAITLVAAILTSTAVIFVFQEYALNTADITPELTFEINASLLAIGALVATGFFVSLLLGFYQADERFFAYSTFRLLNTSGAQLGPLIPALFFDPSINNLLFSVFVFRALVLAALLVGIAPQIARLRSSDVTKSSVKDMLSFGGWISFLSALSPLLVVVDRYIIGFLFGTAMVGVYTIVYNLCSRLLVIPTSIGNVMLPKLARRIDGELLKAARYNQVLTMALLVPTLMFFLALYEIFVSHWLTPDIADQTHRISLALSLGIFFVSLAHTPYSKLTAQGNVRTIAIWHLVQVPFYMLALWLGLTMYGLVGAAVAWCMRACVDAFGLLYFADEGIGKITATGFLLMIVAITFQLLAVTDTARLVVGLTIALLGSLVVLAQLRFQLTATGSVDDRPAEKASS